MRILQRGNRFRRYLIATIAVFGLGFTTSQLSAEHVGNCSPGYPVCMFEAECSGCCFGYSCPLPTCGMQPVSQQCFRCRDCP